MTRKYEPLERFLAGRYPEAVSLTFGEITWWANAANPSHVHAAAWLAAQYRIATVVLGSTATFVGSNERRTTGSGRQRSKAVLDGIEQLTNVLKLAGYPSVVAAVAEHLEIL